MQASSTLKLMRWRSGRSLTQMSSAGFPALLLRSELVVVAKISAQSEAGRSFRVSRHQLVLVVVEIEVERVLRIQINQCEIGVAHSQFSEAELLASVRHVIA